MKKQQTGAKSFGVIGLGRFGSALVKTLTEAGQEVIALDRDEQCVREARKYTDFAFVAESLTQDVLEDAGIQNCDTVAVCIGEKIDTSIITTMLVIKMGIPNVISKATTAEHGEVLRQLGATVVYPESDMAVWVGKRLIFKNLLDFISLDNDVEIRRIQVAGSLIGATIQESDVRQKYSINIIAIERNHQTEVEFSSQYRFQEGDIISVIGKVDKINRFESEIH